VPIVGKRILNSVITSSLSKIIPYVKSADVVLSIGGDNFSNDYGYPRMHLWQLMLAKHLKKGVIVWGSSIGPFDLSKKEQRSIVKILDSNTDLFVVREKISFNNLIDYGIDQNRIKLLMDPAFYMKPKETNDSILKSLIKSRKFIGMNLSPLMARFIKNSESNWNKLAKELIIITNKISQMPILLIPHVDKKNNSDYTFLKELEIESEEIRLLDTKFSANELKWIISKSYCFVGCRTHSTIAAISSNVPTLSIAYSVKALGLNELIFGNTSYVLDINELNLENYARKLRSIISNRTQILQELAINNSFLLQKDITEFETIKMHFCKTE